eukprot:Protomagalhaensia_sp_Gyna_25__1158@NODE_156_length_4776_cov_112_214482_g121_i0_p3_GENE_NODE_156_length_4776_cov_112_214482_g121_i0NODE_156_length_4776_cov_112_214482_g121_i0_p3_ORF_typecomplete_len325_score42_31Thioredoxin_8/PF13905_6/2_2e25PUB/PF09409_10/5e15AhpCTSA/PF00578_21/7_5e08AhpCTSA/PF00578_21/8_9e03Thioredoxin_9/PF14595_6/3_3e06Thioredoxin/PF00085_20/5_2e06Redoxin/PF08534_10/3_1e05Thioredoxin_2/PF13098_6/0_00037Thioredoxin_2/PF13098_6/2e03TraF/PF13728_6/0_008TraF/PF13728_6/5_2e03Thiore
MANDEPFPNPASNRPLTGNEPFVAKQTGPGLATVIGDRLQADVNTVVDLSSINADIVAVYFSAHWCPPCQRFTPLLASMYRAAMLANKSFEIVFGSHDRSLIEFNRYYGQMPWKAIPYADHFRVQTLMTLYNFRGIPSMVVLDRQGNTLQHANVIQQIMRSAESFMMRLPNRPGPPPVATPPAEPVPPVDPAIASLTIDEVLHELQEDVTLNTEQRMQGLGTIKKLLTNIQNDPDDPKYRKINKDNKSVSEKVLKYPVFTKMLKLAGFRETPTSLVVPMQIELPPNFKHMLEVVGALLDSMESASPAAPAGWECKDGVCRRKKD